MQKTRVFVCKSNLWIELRDLRTERQRIIEVVVFLWFRRQRYSLSTFCLPSALRHPLLESLRNPGGQNLQMGL